MKYNIEEQLKSSARRSERLTPQKKAAMLESILATQVEKPQESKVSSQWEKFVSLFQQRMVFIPLGAAAIVVIGFGVILSRATPTSEIAQQVNTPSNDAVNTNNANIPVNETVTAPVIAQSALPRKREYDYSAYQDATIARGGALEMNTAKWAFAAFTPEAQDAQDARAATVFTVRTATDAELKDRAAMFRITEQLFGVVVDPFSNEVFVNAPIQKTGADPLACAFSENSPTQKCIVLSPSGFVRFSQTADVAAANGEQEAKELLAKLYATTAEQIQSAVAAPPAGVVGGAQYLLYPPDYTIDGIVSKQRSWSAVVIDGRLRVLVGTMIQKGDAVKDVEMLSANDAYNQFLAEWKKGAFGENSGLGVYPKRFLFAEPFTGGAVGFGQPATFAPTGFHLEYEMLTEKTQSSEGVYLKPVYRMIGEIAGKSIGFDMLIDGTKTGQLLMYDAYPPAVQ